MTVRLELRLDRLLVVVAGDRELDDREVVDATPRSRSARRPSGSWRLDAVDRLLDLLLGGGDMDLR